MYATYKLRLRISEYLEITPFFNLKNFNRFYLSAGCLLYITTFFTNTNTLIQLDIKLGSFGYANVF